MVSCSVDAALRWNVACHGVIGLGRGEGRAVGERRVFTFSSSTTVTRAPAFSSRSGDPLAVGDDEKDADLMSPWSLTTFGVSGEIGERIDFNEKRNVESRVLTANGLFMLKCFV